MAMSTLKQLFFIATLTFVSTAVLPFYPTYVLAVGCLFFFFNVILIAIAKMQTEIVEFHSSGWTMRSQIFCLLSSCPVL